MSMIDSPTRYSLTPICIVAWLLIFLSPVAHAGQGGFQDDDSASTEATQPEDEERPVEKKKVKQEIDPQMIQVELWDGSVIAGRVKLDKIRVRTEFGVLEVPIGKVRRVLPGYQSYPKIVKEFEALVTQLGDKDFDVREAAQRELTSRGILFREVIANVIGNTNAEQKKRLAEIEKEFDTVVEEMEEEDEGVPRSLIEQDTLETDSFSIVGRIEVEQFLVATKFGELKVTLADIKAGDRTVFQVSPSISRTFTVKGEAFFQRKPTSTRIRVNVGDRISIRGSGTVNWTNWSQTSTVNGLPNQGQYKGMASGTLAARIGTSGKLIKIGEKKVFTATSSGTLYLGVAMQDNYVNESSYRWSGNYRAKVQVEPK